MCARYKKVKVAPFRKEIELVKTDDDSTSIIYYGGKSRDVKWIIDRLPPHLYFIEVFGGGGAVTFTKPLSINNVYNDIGNVAVFWRVVQQWPEELYQKLFWTPYSREEFELCANTWEEYARKSKETGDKEDYLEFARRWFIQINVGYVHLEDDRSFKVAVQVNNASSLRSHCDNLPFLAERLRSIIIERLHFRDLVRLYDRRDSLFYCDPPYLPSTRVSNGTYRAEMTYSEHEEFLKLINKIQGQAVISGYDSELYNSYLADWRKVTKTARSAIQNKSQLSDRGDRTEVLWIKEHRHGLWSLLEESEERAPANVASILD